MSKWITDRLPTFDDADDQGDVYTLNGVLQKWHCIVEDEMWCPLPKSPEPYEPLENRRTKRRLDGFDVLENPD